MDQFINKKLEKTIERKLIKNSNVIYNTTGKRCKKSESNYNNTFICKDDLNVDAVIIPVNYKETYNINTYHKQLLLGNKEYLNSKKDNFKKYIGGNSSFISVPVPPHVNV